ncbi:MAG: SCO family protein [Pedosphaera sp.]|nr:SCO family protein [Pedosphaera sp.]
MPSSRLTSLLWGTLFVGLITVFLSFVKSVRQPSLPPLPKISQLHNFTLTNQVGTQVSLTALSNQVWVANIIFSRCPTQCRKLSRQMQTLQAILPSYVRLVTLTADPEFDTPNVLNRYSSQYECNPDHWWFLSGTKKELYRLAIEDLKFTVIDSGKLGDPLEDLFIHSSAFAIIDRQGTLRGVIHGESVDAENDVLACVTRLKNQSK